MSQYPPSGNEPLMMPESKEAMARRIVNEYLDTECINHDLINLLLIDPSSSLGKIFPTEERQRLLADLESIKEAASTFAEVMAGKPWAKATEQSALVRHDLTYRTIGWTAQLEGIKLVAITYPMLTIFTVTNSEAGDKWLLMNMRPIHSVSREGKRSIKLAGIGNLSAKEAIELIILAATSQQEGEIIWKEIEPSPLE